MGCCRSRDVRITQKPSTDEPPCLLFEDQVISGEVSDSPNLIYAPPSKDGQNQDTEVRKEPENGQGVERTEPDPPPTDKDPENAVQAMSPDPKSEETTTDQCLSDFKEDDDQEASINKPDDPAPLCEQIAVVIPVTALTGFIRESEYSDPEFRALEEYILSLEKSDKWRPIDQPQEWVVGSKLQRSKFNGEVPVFHFTVDFNERIPAEFILGLLDEPDWRTEWDQRVGQINRIRIEEGNYFLQYHLLKCNAPLNSRDFLCKYFIRKVGNETRVIQKSTTHRVFLTQEFPELKNVERAKTYFGMYRIFENDNSTKFHCFVQVNMFFSIKRLQDIMPQFLVRWLGRFRELTLNRYHGLFPKEQH